MSPRTDTKRPLFVIDDDPVLHAMATGWRSVVVWALVGALLGLGWYWLTPPSYTAVVEVEAPETASQIDLNPAGRVPHVVTQDTDAQIIRSDEVAQATAAASGTSAATARDSLSVAVHPLSRVMTISYTGRSSGEAVHGANAAAGAFLERREALLVEPTTDYLERKLDETDTVLPDTGGPSSRREETWSRSLSALLRQPSAGVVLNEATLAAGPDRGDLEVPLVSGMLLAGAGCLFLNAFRHRRGAPVPAARRRAARRRAPRTSRTRLAAACCVVAGISAVGAGAALYLRYPPSYTATASVLIEPLPGTAFSSVGTRKEVESALATEALLATSDQVLADAANGTDLGPAQLGNRTSASSIASAHVVVIEVKDRSQDLATERASHVAQAYIRTRGLRADSTSADRRKVLEAQITKLEADLLATSGTGARQEIRAVYTSRVRTVRSFYGWATVNDPTGGSVLRETIGIDDTSRYVPMASYSLWCGGAALLVAGIWLGLRARTRRPWHRREADATPATREPAAVQ